MILFTIIQYASASLNVNENSIQLHQVTQYPSIFRSNQFRLDHLHSFWHTISTAQNLFQGGSIMPSQPSSKSLLFTQCVNLNTEKCPYRTEPEALLSLIRDPGNFSIAKQKVQELNKECSGCSAFEIKPKGRQVWRGTTNSIHVILS